MLKHRRYTKETNVIQNLGLEDFSKSFIEMDQDREEEKLVVRIIGFASGEVRQDDLSDLLCPNDDDINT